MLCAPYSLHTIDHQQYNVFTQLVQVAVHQVLRQMWSFRYAAKFSFTSFTTSLSHPPQPLHHNPLTRQLSVICQLVFQLLLSSCLKTHEGPLPRFPILHYHGSTLL